MKRWWNPPVRSAYRNLPRHVRRDVRNQIHRAIPPWKWVLAVILTLELGFYVEALLISYPSIRFLGLPGSFLLFSGIMLRLPPKRLVALIRQAGHCVSCGYNLAGNVSGTCPECGEPVPYRREPASKR
jgi:hypothetical protein